MVTFILLRSDLEKLLTGGISHSIDLRLIGYQCAYAQSVLVFMFFLLASHFSRIMFAHAMSRLETHGVCLLRHCLIKGHEGCPSTGCQEIRSQASIQAVGNTEFQPEGFEFESLHSRSGSPFDNPQLDVTPLVTYNVDFLFYD